MFWNKEFFIKYEKEYGKDAAADLLLLVGPDDYSGTHEEYLELEKYLNS